MVLANREELCGVQLNCRSVFSNLIEIKLLVYSRKPDFVALSETWVRDKGPKFIDYKCIWKNRVSTTGGGLGFLLRKGLQFQEVNLNPFPNGVLSA